MFKKISIVLILLVVGILAAALLKSPDFRVERSLVIAAPAEKIFPWFDSHRKFNEWNPWLKMDPAATVDYSGPESGVGAVASWNGGKAGKGSATITESKPYTKIVERMDWLEPMQGVATVEFTFDPAPAGNTKVTWTMYGSNHSLAAKVMSLVINCESVCGPEFEKGLADVSRLVATSTAQSQTP
jgi:hypothetical protein